MIQTQTDMELAVYYTIIQQPCETQTYETEIDSSANTDTKRHNHKLKQKQTYETQAQGPMKQKHTLSNDTTDI